MIISDILEKNCNKDILFKWAYSKVSATNAAIM